MVIGLDPNEIQDSQNAKIAARYRYVISFDPTVIPLSAFAGTLVTGTGGTVKGKAWIKQDDGHTTNWLPIELGAIAPGALGKLISFVIGDWTASAGRYYYDAVHSLNTLEPLFKIYEGSSEIDAHVETTTVNKLRLWVPASPSGRFDGKIIIYKAA